MSFSSQIEEQLPRPAQFLKKGKKKRSWHKAIVYDPRQNSVEIRKRTDLEKDPSRYMECQLPPDHKRVNMFLNSAETEAYAGNSALKGDDNIFIGVLDMDRLGLIDQILRLCGNLRMLYIVKHSSQEMEYTSSRQEDEVKSGPGQISCRL